MTSILCICEEDKNDRKIENMNKGGQPQIVKREELFKIKNKNIFR